MKKVGIMSMQRVYNYGSFLQGYGLKSLIEELGCEVEFVDYHVGECLINDESKQKGLKKLLSNSRAASKLVEYIEFKAPIKEKFKFIMYKKNYEKNNFPKLGIKNEFNYNPKLDVLVIGSDEVFNCVQSNKNVGFSPELFGANNNAKKVMSYAGSFGNTTIDKLKKYNVDKEVTNLLSSFDAISVRDSNSGKIVEELTGINPNYNLDPVLIYDYMNKCKNKINDVADKDYIILYGYSGRFSSEECKKIKEYARKHNKKIYCFGGVQEVCDKFIDCSPFEVLSYFKNAYGIITDTFHGTIFSIITKRKFMTLIRKSHGNRYGNEEKLTDLLKRTKLMDRIANNIDDIDRLLSKDIDYMETFKILEEERIKAKEYLKKNILG
ncbi:MAG: polysaccharide pyruvyl transferase family protein [Clostridium baratii]|uniref:polysaccharide pyruvyl transferase family protein n=1 Tax=Clostridium baratii TaxID=1561 RepID=UPI0024306798|nr:polysaccharide pyruvyl transferase family protein [Clostridium baratii]MBS6007235.1 polysaccharide pyruvyl transferase family protein [Clostridium baratii]